MVLYVARWWVCDRSSRLDAVDPRSRMLQVEGSGEDVGGFRAFVRSSSLRGRIHRWMRWIRRGARRAGPSCAAARRAKPPTSRSSWMRTRGSNFRVDRSPSGTPRCRFVSTIHREEPSNLTSPQPSKRRKTLRKTVTVWRLTARWTSRRVWRLNSARRAFRRAASRSGRTKPGRGAPRRTARDETETTRRVIRWTMTCVSHACVCGLCEHHHHQMMVMSVRQM